MDHITLYSSSAAISELATALCKAQAQFAGADKTAVNPHFKSRYATLQDVWDACRDALTANGFCVLQPVSASTGESVTITTLLLHTSGQWISSALTLPTGKANAQQFGSAITYGRRYGLAAMLGIVADEDDDGNAASSNSESAYEGSDVTRMRFALVQLAAQLPAPVLAECLRECGITGTISEMTDIAKGKALGRAMQARLKGFANE